MTKPQIELQIEKNKKEIIKYSSFLILGMEATTALITKNISLLIPVLALPMVVDSLAINNLLDEKKRKKIGLFFYKPLFKKNLNKWTKNYLDNSESLTEKKYKLIFLNLWAKHKEIPFENVFDKKEISDLSRELIDSGETSLSMQRMFYDNTISIHQQLLKRDVTPKNFFDEDKNTPQKIDIAKRVYEEFSNIGLAAKTLITGKDFSFLLELQNYKFNEIDFDYIKQYLDNIKEENKEIYSITYINPYIDSTIDAINKIVASEENIDNLKLLQKYCDNMTQRDHTPMMQQVQELQKSLNTKFNYLNMGMELNNEKVLTSKKPNKI